MVSPTADFGAELRRVRTAAGWSLAMLASRVHYSRGHLSKVENGLKPAYPELARSCDAALGANGELARLVPVEEPAEPIGGALPDGDVWVVEMGQDGTSRMRMLDRRQLMAAGAISAVGFSFGGDFAATAQAEGSLAAFRELFDRYRALGQQAAPAVLLPVLTAQTHTLRRLAVSAGGRTGAELHVLSARFAEFAGWMAQESGDDTAAMWWTDRAVELAEFGGDRDLTTYSLVRRALVTLYRQDAAQTVELARRAQSGAVPPRIVGLAAQREAQGHALAGDVDGCLRSLDRSREFLARSEAAPATPVLGTAHVSDPAAMAAGWCLHDLGRSREAADLLDRECARLGGGAARSRARWGVRRALAHAASGEVEHACWLTGELLSEVGLVDSATVAHDLRRLARTLARFHAVPAVRELTPRLSPVFHRPAS